MRLCAQPDWGFVHRELARVGVTLKLLHGEHRDACAAMGAADGMQQALQDVSAAWPRPRRCVYRIPSAGVRVRRMPAVLTVCIRVADAGHEAGRLAKLRISQMLCFLVFCAASTAPMTFVGAFSPVAGSA